MKHLRNTWYLAAWADEVQPESVLGRTIVDEALALFRDVTGMPIALYDRCPHRFAPLSKGRLHDGVVHCAYHGLAFGAAGRCVMNPHGPIPRAAAVRVFPCVERHAAIWVFMGDPDAAEAAAIPDLGFIDRTAAEARVTGRLHTRANYQLMVDNIMDLSHADYLHPDSLGGGINTRTRGRVTRSGDEVAIKWHARHEQLPPVMDAMLAVPGQSADFINEVYWQPPGVMRQRVLFGPAGELDTLGQDSWTAHVMVPETATSTHYFFAHTSDLLNRDPSLASFIEQTLRKAFATEDSPLIEAQQQRLGDVDFADASPVLLSIDAGPVEVRRVMERLIAAQS